MEKDIKFNRQFGVIEDGSSAILGDPEIQFYTMLRYVEEFGVAVDLGDKLSDTLNGIWKRS